MIPELIRILSDQGGHVLVIFLLVGVLRPVGLLFGFVPFMWAFGQGQMIRMGVAFALGLPTLAAVAPDLATLAASKAIAPLALVAIKEISLGLLLGFVLSLPFFALRFAGSIVATYKGESDGGFEAPNDGTMESLAKLFQLIGLAAFAYAGGVWITVSLLYDSYKIWPLLSVFPVLQPGAADVALEALGFTLWLAIQTALPLLVILVFVDFSLAIAGRIGRRFRFYEMSFLLKNLTALLLLPMMTYIIWIVNSDIVSASANGFDFFRAFFE